MDISKINFAKTENKLNGLRFSSPWQEAVQDYAQELLKNVSNELEWYRSENKPTEVDLISACFNTSVFSNESDFDVAIRCSEGGCFLIYDEGIARKLCTSDEFERLHYYKDGSLKNPNPRENWLQCQGRALFQAFRMLKENLVLTE